MLSPYDIRTEETRNKITEGKTSFYTNRVYKNSVYNWYWYINSKGYFHILKPCKINFDGHFSHYEIEDILLKSDNMTKSSTKGFYKTKEDCIQEIEKDMIKEDQPINYDIEIQAIENKRYSTLYAGCIGDKVFVIDINNNIKCGMEYDFNSKEDFTEEEVEQIANSILDGKYINNNDIVIT
jgi:hypothetical protein